MLVICVPGSLKPEIWRSDFVLRILEYDVRILTAEHPYNASNRLWQTDYHDVGYDWKVVLHLVYRLNNCFRVEDSSGIQLLDRAVLYLSASNRRWRRPRSVPSVVYGGYLFQTADVSRFLDLDLSLVFYLWLTYCSGHNDIATFYYQPCDEYFVVYRAGGPKKLCSVPRRRLSIADSRVQ